ncbi:hypothetical protein ACGFZU_35165 [Streptomyces tendae]|uniref:hypothetical protein n=1 Tax=Streptomyces tendae TaxID=1932 RepID=UPI003711E2F2
MTTAPAPVAAPETVAASLFVGAFNNVYEDDPRMTIALHLSNGSTLAVAGVLDDYRMRFDPAEVSTLLVWLTRAVATDPDAVITVTAAYRSLADGKHGWAWYIGTGEALSRGEAATLFPNGVDLLGAAESHVTLGGRLVDTSADGLAYTALTGDVKAVVTAHGEPERPAVGHRYALRTDGMVTVYVDAADETAARDALEGIELEDFDVDLRTRDGHVIGHVTLGEADGAELVSVDGTPADELD